MLACNYGAQIAHGKRPHGAERCSGRVINVSLKEVQIPFNNDSPTECFFFLLRDFCIHSARENQIMTFRAAMWAVPRSLSTRQHLNMKAAFICHNIKEAQENFLRMLKHVSTQRNQPNPTTRTALGRRELRKEARAAKYGTAQRAHNKQPGLSNSCT